MKLLWSLGLLALVVIHPVLKSFLPWLRETTEITISKLAPKSPDKQHRSPEQSEAERNLRKAIDHMESRRSN